MPSRLLMTFNAGSSTVKIGIFELRHSAPVRIGKAVVDFGGKPLTLHVTEGPQQYDLPLKGQAQDDLSGLMDEVLQELGRHFDFDGLQAAGHRIVHGGETFTEATKLDDATIRAVEDLTELAPLHQPQSVRLIRAMKDLRPDLPQTGSFDTTFHVSQDDLVRRFAIPRNLHDQGIKRYGFHGLSYRYISEHMARHSPAFAAKKLVVAHLGSGASLCAIENGRSRDCSMGFSALDGVPMATRPGWLDPGVLLHLIGPLGKSRDEVEDLLYHRCGLLGVSGSSGDLRALAEDESEPAEQAIDLFVLRVAGEIARLAATLEGLDAIVFTAGVGENQPMIRSRICRRLAFLGIELDETANGGNASCISKPDSRVAAFVIPTDEEQVIAEDCAAVAIPA